MITYRGTVECDKPGGTYRDNWDDQLIPGLYVNDPLSGQPTVEPSKVPCPFCGERLLVALSGVWYRTATPAPIEEDGNAFPLADYIPDTHAVYGCIHCHIGFTVPKEGGGG